MKRILGLDLGTNSIGWAVIEKDRNYDNSTPEKIELIDKGALIFSEGVKIEKGNESSKAAERTGYRSARRINFRRKLRKYETLKVLIDNGMCPLEDAELENWRSSINPENGKRQSFKQYPKSDAFLQWLHTDNQQEEAERKKQRKNPYFLRAKALDEKLTKEELGRVFYHFAQRRGFLSGRLDTSDTTVLERELPQIQEILETSTNLTELRERLEEYYSDIDLDDADHKDLKKLKKSFDTIIKKNEKELEFSELKQRLNNRLNKKENLGKVKQGISELTDEIEANDFRTMGEYFYHLYKDGKKIRKRYTAREEHYLEEFEQICLVQGLDGIIENEKDPSTRYTGIVKDLYRAIFYQRPLKSQKGTIGKCSFEKDKPRCPVSHPDFEEFRMLSFLNNVKIKTPEDEKLRWLTDDEKETAKQKFYRKKASFPFEDIAKALAPKNSYAFYKSKQAETATHLFNYSMKTTVAGCPTTASLKNLFGDLNDVHFEYSVKTPKGETKSKSVNYHDLWHVLFSFDKKEKLEEFAQKKLGLDERKARSFSRIQIKKDYGRLSLKAIRNILPYLRDGLLYPHAVFMANLENIIDRDKWKGNEDFLRKTIRELIDNDREDNRLTGIANDLFHWFKKEYGENNHHRGYELDDTDRAEIQKRLELSYGKKGLEQMGDEKRQQLFDDLSSRFLKCLHSGKFLQKKRLDEKVIQLISDNELCSDPSRLEKLYHPSDIDTYKTPKRAEDGKLYLGSPMTDSVRNPMAMRALHQLRKLVNTLIKEGTIDEYTHINIELARELNDANKRKAIQKWQKQLEDEKTEYRKEIAKLYKEASGNEITPTEDDVLKYKLWIEQNKKCLYSPQEKSSIKITDFIGPNPKFDIEHTLPRSVSQDNSLMNKTLCDRTYNREVKKNRIPFDCPNYEEILPRIKHWKDKYEALNDQMENVTRQIRGKRDDKEAKDRLIEKRYLLKLEHDYYKGKYERFTMKEIKEGFKNSQKVDIGIISKLSRAYLASVFPKVYSVKGSTVAEFRKAWGLQEVEREKDGKAKLHEVYGTPIYKEKDRSNHAHHCQDAVVIASMDKKLYDTLAAAWRSEEKEDYKTARQLLEQSKPWKTFTQDVKAIPEEILVVHHTPDNVGKKAKRKMRKRGEIEKDKRTGRVKYMQGDAARGSLHREFFYGAILRPEKDKTDAIKLDKNGEPIEKLFYVRREELAGLKDADLKHIVDDRVKQIAFDGRKKEKELRHEIKSLEKELKNAEEHEEAAIKDRIKTLKETIENDIYVLPNKNGAPVPIKKVRLKRPSVTDPIHLKPHRDRSKHDHKANYHVMNDENYMMALYEGENPKGKWQREFQLVNLLNASTYFNHMNDTDMPVEKEYKGLPIRCTLTKGKLVLFYTKTLDEPKSLTQTEIINRLYQVRKLNKDGRVMFSYHQLAQNDEQLKASYEKKHGNKPPKNLTDGVSSIDYEKPHPKLLLSKGNLNILVEGVDFKLSRSGKVKFLF